MKTNKAMYRWLIAGLVAIFISACATTQDDFGVEDGPPPEDQTLQQIDGTQGDDPSGADASALDDGSGASATAIADDSPLSAREALQQTEGMLASRTIYFEFDSAQLTDESLSILETHGNFIAGNGEVSVRLEGHTDERGSREYNIALGDRRAQSVRRVLLFQGASVDQLETVSYGEEQPAMAGHDESSWSKNRRVELIYQVN